jgi:hypothetical protein
MKIASSHLEAIRLQLLEQSTALDSETKTAKAAADQRDKRTAAVRALNGAFDVCAASFAQDTELSASQLNDMPAEVQQALGYKPVGKPAAPKA